ncbi:MAG: DNA-directed RNA polymerase subunit delta [Bacilli bacterium]|nr:DNA-directed RNA polymerase subunit delta [Bacilli bacterium]
MLRESMVEVAYELMQKKQGAQKFVKFYEEVAALLAMSEEEAEQNISKFYTKLTLDERFVLLEDNTWDLRERQSFDKVHIDMNDIYSEIEEEEKEMEEEREEERLYDDDAIVVEEEEEKPRTHDDDEEEEDY